MLINAGDKILLIARRNFDGDLRRHFVGEVTCANAMAVLGSGYVLVFNPRTTQYIRKPELRSRIISLMDGGNEINLLPKNTNIEKVVYKVSKDRHLVVTDDDTFAFDVDEFALQF